MSMTQFSPEIIYAAIALIGLLVGVLVTVVLWRINHNKKWNEQAALLQRTNELETELKLAQVKLDHLEQIKNSLQEKDQQLSHLNRDNAGLKAQLEQQKIHYEQQLQLLKEAREQLTKEFENLANKIFESKQLHFKQQSQQTLEGALNPLREQLKDFKKQVQDVYEKENAERNKLVGQITELQKQTQQIGQDAVNLANALKGSNKAQGNWGEIILERLLEESGLKKGREYETQVSLRNEAGQRRNPDVIVRLPENKDIVIDAKVSLVDYEQYCNSEDRELKQQYLHKHIASIRSHIDALNKKDYERLENIRSLDFVFIFVPIEAAFMLALDHEPGLFKYAYDKHIILVSPTTLLATLRTVESIWRYEKQNRNAEKIASMAGGLHDQFALLIEAFQEVGQNIDKAQKSYELVQNRLQHGRGNLIKRVRDLEILGAKTKKSLSIHRDDEADPIELEDIELENNEPEEIGSARNLLETEIED